MATENRCGDPNESQAFFFGMALRGGDDAAGETLDFKASANSWYREPSRFVARA